MSDSSPYKIPRAPGRWRAITLAVVVHLALLAFLWIGISWQNETPLTVEAEIWDPQYKEAAPLPTPPEPQPQPEPPKPEPVPQPQPEPKAPPKVIDEPKVEKPDINLEKEKEKKRKEELEKKEKAEKLKAEKEREKKEQEEKDKAEREKQQKLDADKQKKLKEEKQKEEEAKKKADAEKQAAEKKKQQQAAADAKAAEQRRQDDLKRMMGQATSATGGTGTAEKSQGPRGNPDYANKLRAKIRSNTIFDVPADLSGNPAVEYTVELFPDGTVRSIRNGKSSGVPGFDEAVKQAITKSQPFPPDKDGKVPGSFTFTHKPKDQ